MYVRLTRGPAVDTSLITFCSDVYEREGEVTMVLKNVAWHRKRGKKLSAVPIYIQGLT